jgi:GNAT superfamily N-acetyltransferase
MGARFFAGGDYRGPKVDFDRVHFAAHLADMITSPLAGVFVAERCGRVAGMIAGLLIASPYTGEPVCLKTQWIADPSRGRGSGLALLRHLEKWATARGARKMFAASMSVKGAAVLERCGFVEFEANFTKVLT